MGVSPFVPARLASDGRKLVRVSAAEVQRLKALAAFAPQGEDEMFDAYRPLLGLKAKS